MKYEFMGFDEATLKRFWSKVDRRGPDECWEFSGSKNKSGYGQIYLAGKMYRAHRVALTLYSNRYHNKLDALHSCDNKACCNPKHLRWGTDLDNYADFRQRHNRAYRHNLIKAQRASRKRSITLSAYVKWFIEQGTPTFKIIRGMCVPKHFVKDIVEGKVCHLLTPQRPPQEIILSVNSVPQKTQKWWDAMAKRKRAPFTSTSLGQSPWGKG